MSGNVVQLRQPGAKVPDQVLTKKELAAHLGRSERWVEIKVKEGMPAEPATDRYGRRRYNLRLVQDWLKDGKPTAPVDRVSALEDRVASLSRQVAELRRAG